MFDNSVGSVAVLSLIDMAVVFGVLALLMIVVYATAFGVKLTGRRSAAEPAVEPAVEPAAAPSPASPAPEVADVASVVADDELELVAVQAAALAAHAAWAEQAGMALPEEAHRGGDGMLVPPPGNTWRSGFQQQGTRPRWR